jgi:hypothetical protein
MRTAIILTLMVLGYLSVNAQMDTIYTGHDKLVVTVREVGADEVKFVYQNEDLVNSIFKNTIQKIVFKSGRVQTFAQTTSLKVVKSADDWENVAVTQLESETKGLYKLGDVSAKAKGTTELANQERVKQRALRKLKIETAMLGGNLVYTINQRSQGNIMGSQYTSGQSTETSFTGIAYSNTLPDYNKFMSKIGDRKDFIVWSLTKLWSSSSDMTYVEEQKAINIEKVYQEGGTIMVNAATIVSKQPTFRVTYFDDEYFTLMYRDKSTIYNLYVYWEN